MRISASLKAGAIVVLTALTLSSAAASATASPPTTVTATQITRVHGTLRRGALVRSRSLGHRVFADSRFGFALADVGGAQYPAVTTNGGGTWRVNGPALHLNAAQAPLSVTDVGLAGRRTYFAYGGGQVIDTTNDGGRHWWRAFLGDAVLGASAFGAGHLIAFSQVAAGTGGTTATNLVYVSHDGGKHWHLSNALGAP